VVDRTGAPDYKPALPPLAPGPAQVAQLVEHATENRSVGGSIPPLGTISIFSSINQHLNRRLVRRAASSISHFGEPDADTPVSSAAHDDRYYFVSVIEVASRS
jgi:hypothetical protein